MNDTDSYMCIAPNKYWIMTVKKIDQFLHRAIKYYNDHGNMYVAADKDQLDELIGYWNTAMMVLHDASGLSLNWDQQAVTDSSYNTYNAVGANNPILQEDINENTTVNR